MKIEKKDVTQLTISEVENLDTIDVILEDFGPRQGRITIRCYNQVWTSFWGGMGDRTIAEFFCSCDNSYLAKNISNIRRTIVDVDGLVNHARKHIGKLLVNREINRSEAIEWLNDLDSISGYDLYNNGSGSDLLCNIYGNEFWHFLPEKENHEYKYLWKIIETVKIALKKSHGPHDLELA